ncbi:MAG: hypothetical protein E7441_10630, partial [Ruminococcaceae bacterium]|nr:hypothetical protein [Oscillospiraceae bacterium]
MKKALSLILALALVISLVPLNISAVETGATKTFYFAKVNSCSGGVSSLKEDRDGTPTGIDYLPEKSTETKSDKTYRLMDNVLIQVVTEKTLWKDASNNESQLVFTADLGTGASAGWYQIAFTGGNWYPASDLYIYANDTYVGNYIPKKNVEDYEIGDTKTYGAVYLEPDANGKVEFKVAAAKMGVRGVSGDNATTAYWEGRILLSS